MLQIDLHRRSTCNPHLAIVDAEGRRGDVVLIRVKDLGRLVFEVVDCLVLVVYGILHLRNECDVNVAV